MKKVVGTQEGGHSYYDLGGSDEDGQVKQNCSGLNPVSEVVQERLQANHVRKREWKKRTGCDASVDEEWVQARWHDAVVEIEQQRDCSQEQDGGGEKRDRLEAGKTLER